MSLPATRHHLKIFPTCHLAPPISRLCLHLPPATILTFSHLPLGTSYLKIFPPATWHLSLGYVSNRHHLKIILTCHLAPQQRVLSHCCLKAGWGFHLQMRRHCKAGELLVLVLVLVLALPGKRAISIGIGIDIVIGIVLVLALQSRRAISIGGRGWLVGFAIHCSVSDDCNNLYCRSHDRSKRV